MPMSSPFDLHNASAYARWRDAKRASHPAQAEALIVDIADPCQLTVAEKSALLERCARANMAIYRSRALAEDKNLVRLLSAQLGLHRLDAICDRADISLDDDVNRLIVLARNRDTIYSKPELATIVHACKEEIIPNMLKVHMKAFKAMVRKNLGIN